MAIPSIIGNKYSVHENIGHGSFGQIYRGKNIHTDEEVAIKLEIIQTKHPQLLYESKVIKYLQGGLGIPEVHWCGALPSHNVMIIDMLGCSLEELFTYSKRKLSLKTVLMILDQVLARIQYIHSKNYIHRDIKPDNFLIGKHKRCMIIYAIDFGLAKRFRDQKGNHIKFIDQKSLTGTARYASVNAHLGREQSRRDDLEAILYMMIYFLKGSLPWQGLNVKTREEKYRLIAERKRTCKSEELCSDLPVEFLNYLTYVKHLGFKDDPDYRKLRRSFKELFIKNEFLYDYEYDWKVIGHQGCKYQDQIIELEEEKEEKSDHFDENPDEVNENEANQEKNDIDEEKSPRDPDQIRLEEAVEEYLKQEKGLQENKKKKKCILF